MENGKISKLYHEKYWIFFLCKISNSIICFEFSEKYLPTSTEVEKKYHKFLMRWKIQISIFYYTFNGIIEKILLLCEMFFFSFSERVKNEAGRENKEFKNYNCVGIYASYKFQ